MRILHVIHGLTLGGAEVDLVRKARQHVERGWDVTVCCLMRRGELAEEAEAGGIRVIGPLMKHRYDAGAAGQLAAVLADPRWSLVHSHIFAGNLVTWLVRQVFRNTRSAPLLTAEHGMAERWGRTTLSLQRRIAATATLMQVPSDAARASYLRRGFRENGVRVVPNAIPVTASATGTRESLRAELGLSPEEFVVGTVSRLESIKGLETLLRAADSLRVRLMIAGDGKERGALERLARELGASDRITFLGSRRDIPELLGAWDAFALHSRSESFGMAVAEAMLAGLPVVATRVGAIPELTLDGTCARLVPSNDAGAFAEGLRWTMENRREAADRSRTGGNHVRECFSVERVAELQASIYAEVVDDWSRD